MAVNTSLTMSAGTAAPDEKPVLDVLRVAFRAMGTEIALAVWPRDGEETVAEARLWGAVDDLRSAEALLSRFQPDSEISRLNRGATTPVPVSSLTFAAIEVALDAAAASN